MSKALLVIFSAALLAVSAAAQSDPVPVTGCGTQTSPCTAPPAPAPAKVLMAAWRPNQHAMMPMGVALFSPGAETRFTTSATTPLNACDLNQDGSVTVADIQLATNMAIGVTACSANIYGTNVCNVVMVQRVTNAAMGGGCITGTHTVSLSWTPSTSPNITGYNIYRGTTSGGPYTKLNSAVISGSSYVDSVVQSGQTYYYVATAVNSSNTESTYSTQTAAAISNP